MMRSSVDRPGVKPLCCGRCFAKIVLFIRARHMWAKTLAGTERSDMPRYLVQSDFGPFPFQSGRIMAMFQSVGMTQYFQMRVKISDWLTTICRAVVSARQIVHLFQTETGYTLKP